MKSKERFGQGHKNPQSGEEEHQKSSLIGLLDLRTRERDALLAKVKELRGELGTLQEKYKSSRVGQLEMSLAQLRRNLQEMMNALSEKEQDSRALQMSESAIRAAHAALEEQYKVALEEREMLEATCHTLQEALVDVQEHNDQLREDCAMLRAQIAQKNRQFGRDRDAFQAEIEAQAQRLEESAKRLEEESAKRKELERLQGNYKQERAKRVREHQESEQRWQKERAALSESEQRWQKERATLKEREQRWEEERASFKESEQRWQKERAALSESEQRWQKMRRELMEEVKASQVRQEAQGQRGKVERQRLGALCSHLWSVCVHALVESLGVRAVTVLTRVWQAELPAYLKTLGELPEGPASTRVLALGKQLAEVELCGEVALQEGEASTTLSLSPDALTLDASHEVPDVLRSPLALLLASAFALDGGRLLHMLEAAQAEDEGARLRFALRRPPAPLLPLPGEDRSSAPL